MRHGNHAIYLVSHHAKEAPRTESQQNSRTAPHLTGRPVSSCNAARRLAATNCRMDARAETRQGPLIMSIGTSRVARHLGFLAPVTMLLFLTSTAMCARAPEPSAPSGSVQATTYSAAGVVKSIDTSDKSILIKHEDIPGFMKAMTMLFELRDLDQVKGIAAGDAIKFTFTDEGNGRLVIQTLQKTP